MSWVMTIVPSSRWMTPWPSGSWIRTVGIGRLLRVEVQAPLANTLRARRRRWAWPSDFRTWRVRMGRHRPAAGWARAPGGIMANKSSRRLTETERAERRRQWCDPNARRIVVDADAPANAQLRILIPWRRRRIRTFGMGRSEDLVGVVSL